MAIVPPGTLKGYFNAGDVPTEANYIDLIDSLGIPTTSVLATGNWNDYKENGFYRGSNLTNSPTVAWYYVLVQRHDDNYVSQTAFYYYGNVVYHRVCSGGTWTSWNLVFPAQWNDIQYKPTQFTPTAHTHTGADITSAVGDSNKLGGINAGSYLIQQSTSRPGVTKLYRADSDSGYYVRHYWTGSHWYLQGYNASDVYHAGCRVAYADTAGDAGTLDSIDSSQFARSDANDTITGLWSISNDLRIANGLYVGSTGVNPTDGNVQATADICAGGGVYAGNAAAAVANGYVEASSHIVANGQVFGRSSDQYFKTSVNIGYSSDVDSNRFKLLNESVNFRIEKAYAGTSVLWFNWVGNGAGTRTTRCANGNGGYGNIHADNFVNESTRASKRNIRSYKAVLPSSLDVVDRIEPVKFEKINGGHKNQQKERIGFIAEDLADVLPEVVAFDENGHPEGIAYDQIVPLLVLSIQELRSQVKELQHGRNIGD